MRPDIGIQHGIQHAQARGYQPDHVQPHAHPHPHGDSAPALARAAHRPRRIGIGGFSHGQIHVIDLAGEHKVPRTRAARA